MNVPAEYWLSSDSSEIEDRIILTAEITLLRNNVGEAEFILRKGLTQFPRSSLLKENIEYVIWCA